MAKAGGATVHASAVLVGARAVLIRGPSAAGKSRLAWELIEAGRGGAVAFARLVGDDRVHLQPASGRLLVRPNDAIAGLIELRGIGILQRDHEPCAVIGLVVDLAAADAERLPERGQTIVEGITIPCLAVAPGVAALPLVLAMVTSGGLASVSKPTLAAAESPIGD